MDNLHFCFLEYVIKINHMYNIELKVYIWHAMENERHIDVYYYGLPAKGKQANRLHTHAEFCSPFQRCPESLKHNLGPLSH